MLRRALSVERRVAVTLWCLATPSEYRTIAHLFGIARSTVCEIVHETCQCIVDILMEDYIKFPSGDRLDLTVDEFKTKWGVPSALEPSMAPMCQYQRHTFYILTITIVRGGTPC